MHSGIIRLYYEGKPIKSLAYSTVRQRRQIVENWRLQTGQKFQECELHIIPDDEKEWTINAALYTTTFNPQL
jgi:hypothetical protein